MSPTIKRQALLLFVLLSFTFNLKVKAANETIPAGSFIVNMGVLPVTYANALKPYGMVNDLTRNYGIPVKWVINPSKVRNGVDFTYNSTNYSGGPFIVPANYITPTIAAVISTWIAQGIIGVYTTSPIVVPVFETITLFPLTVIDNQNNIIVEPYYANAGIPSSSYVVGTPADLTICYDLYALPHADPTWPIHSNLYDFVVTQRGSIWAACHAASVLEGSNNPNPPFQQLNYLTTNGLQCYGNGGCGPITQVHAKFPTSPYSYPATYAADPVMQFIGNLHGATENGSERWYVPQTTGQWLATTKRTLTTMDGVSPKEGVKVAYGPAYGNASNGLVMYEAGHSHVGGALDNSVAAQRAFFNFALLVGVKAKLKIVANFPTILQPGTSHPMDVTVTGGVPPYTYVWAATCTGTFSSDSTAATNFTLPFDQRPPTCDFSIIVTDACGRRSIQEVKIPVNTVLPVDLLSFNGEPKNNSIQLNWKTGSETNNDFFKIERIDNFNNEFIEIGKVKGSGTTSIGASYQFIDTSFEGLTGNYYYRLSQTDYDGTSKILGTIVVPYKAEMVIATLSNSFFDQNTMLNIESEEFNKISMRLISSEGRIVLENELVLNQGQNKINIGEKSNQLPNGFYYLQLLNSEQNLTFHLIKNSR